MMTYRNGKRKGGRQCKRWDLELKLTAGSDRNMIARAGKWKRLEKVY